tara:strand:- start:522 stop:815 length:294 start_codon:yes stop_codon:yes gene_type:complete
MSLLEFVWSVLLNMPSKVNKIKVIDKKLGRQKAVGQAYTDAKVIEIDPRQTSRNYLDTLIHELLHVYNPEWSENKVSKTANEITDIIWKKNYRRIKR